MLGCENHYHVPTLLPGALLDHRNLYERLCKAVKQHLPTIDVNHLPASEHHGNLSLIPFLQKALGVPGLELEIMILSLRPKFDLFNLNNRLLLLRLPRLLTLFVAVFPIVHDPANRRLRLRRHLHQIERKLLGGLESLLNRQDAQLCTLRANHSYLFDPNPLVHPNSSTDEHSLLRDKPAKSS